MTLSSKSMVLISLAELEELSSIIVAKFIRRGVIPFNDKDDIKQTIIEKFLLKQASLVQSYSGKASKRTFCSAVLYKMTCEIIRKELKNWKNINSDTSEMLTGHKDIALTPEQTTIINNEVDLLEKVLTTLGKEQYKTLLFLKYYYRIPVNNKDITGYLKKGNAKLYLPNPIDAKDKDIFDYLSKMVELAEGKVVQPDAVRMYVNKQINSILLRLNGKFNRADYNKETLGLLFEIYAQKEKEPMLVSLNSVIILMMLSIDLI